MKPFITYVAGLASLLNTSANGTPVGFCGESQVVGLASQPHTNASAAQPAVTSCEEQSSTRSSESYERSLESYVDAVIAIESSGDAHAKRYEPHLDDWSYGLGQLLTKTALSLEKRHSELPRLGTTAKNVREHLFDPKINRQYTTALFKEELDFYQDPLIAAAAYNAGHFAPQNARVQEQLNDLYGTRLECDGDLGSKSKELVKRFQSEHKLDVDGIVGPKTYKALQEQWETRYPEKTNAKGIIPQNNRTPYHVKKFVIALESSK